IEFFLKAARGARKLHPKKRLCPAQIADPNFNLDLVENEIGQIEKLEISDVCDIAVDKINFKAGALTADFAHFTDGYVHVVFIKKRGIPVAFDPFGSSPDWVFQRFKINHRFLPNLRRQNHWITHLVMGHLTACTPWRTHMSIGFWRPCVSQSIRGLDID